MLRWQRHHPGSGWWWLRRCRKTGLDDCQTTALGDGLLFANLLLPATRPAAMATTGARYLKDIFGITGRG
jgi:hypothetical protein